MKELTAATRGGELAIVQTRIIEGMLRTSDPDLRIKVKKVGTKGDSDRSTVLWKLNGAGFFTSRVEEVLLAGEADFAVHSFKDLPVKENESLIIAAVCNREFAEDCLIAAGRVNSIEELPVSARVGTSSLRRVVQIKRLRADLEPVPIRGNVPTRIGKVDKREFDAIVLARAGVERIGLAERISFCFNPLEFLPAAAQGALAVQCREGNDRVREILSRINDEEARILSFAERKVLSEMQCGCHAPVGVFAKIDGDDIIIRAFISDLQGSKFIKRVEKASVGKAEQLAKKIGFELLDAGGREILKKLERQNEAGS